MAHLFTPLDPFAFIRNHSYVKRPTSTGNKPSFDVKRLGVATFPNTFEPAPFVDGMTTLIQPTFANGAPVYEPEFAEIAGPRAKLFWDPSQVTAAVVTCGGLCPGLNNVVRSLVLSMTYRYGVKQILGFKFGYEGLTPNHEPVLLTPAFCKDIHILGGSVLKSSRGQQSPQVMADTLVKYGVNVLFAIGGDGTQTGALEIAREVERRGLKIGIVGLPKTIDNDICYTDATFGFNTAVTMAQAAISAVHHEARSARGGIGFVKLMGRDAGFIALHSALSNGDVNLVLIPEVKFRVEVVLNFLEERLCGPANHAVVVMAEGAGQHLMSELPDEFDKSGNRLQKDAAKYLIKRIQEHFKAKGIECNLKYVDPSYTIRGAPAIPSDQMLCHALATNAVHAGLAGMTEVVVCHHHHSYIYVPIPRAVYFVKRVNPLGPLYRILLDSTGMPDLENKNVYGSAVSARSLKSSRSGGKDIVAAAAAAAAMVQEEDRQKKLEDEKAASSAAADARSIRSSRSGKDIAAAAAAAAAMVQEEDRQKKLDEEKAADPAAASESPATAEK